MNGVLRLTIRSSRDRFAARLHGDVCTTPPFRAAVRLNSGVRRFTHRSRNVSRTYTVFLNDKQIKVTDEDLSAFADFLSLAGDLRSRISELLLLDLFVYANEFGVDPSSVVNEIKHLEGGGGNSSTLQMLNFIHD